MAPRLTYEQMLEAETPVTIINEPVDFVIDFAVEEPQRESATARAMRIWFKQTPLGGLWKSLLQQ
jgi:hypothetical protein